MGEKKPIKFNPREESLRSFRNRFPTERVIDSYQDQLEELFLIRNPRYRFNKNYQKKFKQFLKEYSGSRKVEDAGNWFYFPWNKLLVRYLPDEMHQELRTARNKNLISNEEQEKFYNFKIGIAGLSVGSHAALTISMMGGGKIIKLADPDEISGSNLNRIRYDFTAIGINKCNLAAHQIYQINPYADIYSYLEGVTKKNINEFLTGPPKIDALIEELDNPLMKLLLRLKAREAGIPVITATDNGDNVIVDIERYDLNPELPVFNGALGDITIEGFKKSLPRELPKIATKIAGPDVVVPRMLTSILEVGKTLYSWPQLGSAATLSGAALAYIVKKMALGEPLKAGKLEVNLDSIFEPEYHSPASVQKRKNDRKEILKIIGIK